MHEAQVHAVDASIPVAHCQGTGKQACLIESICQADLAPALGRIISTLIAPE